MKRDTNKSEVYERTYQRVFPIKINETNNSSTARAGFSSREGLTNILSGASFTSIEIHEESKIFYNKGKDEWWNEQSNNATRGFFERIKSTDPLLFNEFKTAVYEEVEEHIVGGHIKFEANVQYKHR